MILASPKTSKLFYLGTAISLDVVFGCCVGGRIVSDEFPSVIITVFFGIWSFFELPLCFPSVGDFKLPAEASSFFEPLPFGFFKVVVEVEVDEPEVLGVGFVVVVVIGIEVLVVVEDVVETG